jgi:hypothetical protein
MNLCEECKLYNQDTPRRVCIPPPKDKIRGCLISRDPTNEFLVPLSQYKHISPDQRGLLWFNAPPCWLCDKIRLFMNYSEQSSEMIKLRSFFDHECYWTHLHKCPTCKPGKKQDQTQISVKGMDDYFPPFEYSTAKSCALKWFDFEFDEYDLKDKVIITCGRDVEYFFKQWSKDNSIKNSKKVISLPHPSGANCGNGWSWKKNTDYQESITDEINHLLNLI